MFMTVSSFFLLLIIFLLLIGQLLLSEKEVQESNSILTPLESGFESLKSSLVLSSPFFFLAVLFVLFDLELILLFPSIMCFLVSFFFSFVFSMILTLIFLTLALEWAWYGLKWQV